ncbi:unnamed protein product [Rotaria socialis]|uniref:SAM domain-containing protein n=1 Tax=Rotaria socialis TaxID=392032 RepID=A0A820T4A5_9BILA|nr:unnamed protein product [Rotaria socialis]
MSISNLQKCTICLSNVDRTTHGYLRHLRQVHGNDHLFNTSCPLCDSNFIYTNLKSFINHFRKHDFNSSGQDHSSLSLAPPFNDFNLDNHDDTDDSQQIQQASVWQSEHHGALDEIRKFYVKMLLKVREGHVLPGNIMKTMALSITCLLENFSYYLLSKLNINVDNVISYNFNNDIEKNIFEISRNEDSFIAACQSYFKFVKPKEILLPTGSKAYYIPLHQLLKNLFETQGFYDCVKQEKELISQFHGQDIIYHYQNAEFGRQHPVLQHKTNCFSLQLYSDDLGVVNPLMDDLPARHNSSLSAVHLLLLYYKKDFDDEKNRKILFAQLSKDLNSLEEDGLILPGDKNPTYFTISTLCADNLSAHELGGFTKTFTSGYCCRYCFTNHKDMKYIYKETQTSIRTSASYDLQLQHIQTVPSDKSLYGINDLSPLSSISSFHPIMSLPPDLMHDVMEGVMPKLTGCLLHVIVSSRLHTCSQVCQMINKFNFGNNDKRNRPVAFKEKDISEGNVRGKAMEKYCLFLNLPFIFYEIIDKIPYWFLYELLREIWDILYADHPRKSWLSTLEVLIQEFLQLFQTIFPENFVPKFHFLLHAARNTAKYGPLKRQMNLRYEAKHHLLKQMSNRCNNFINLPYTISKRIQLRQCYELIDENLLKLNNISGTIRKRRTTSFNLSIQNILFNDRLFAHRDVVHIVKWIIMDNIKFKVGDFFVGFLLGGEEIPIFVKIKYILNMSEQWKFVVQCFDTVTFKQNLWCFEIKPSNNNLIFNKFSMEWNYQDVSYWLMENGFEKFINKFQEEEIDGLSLLNLSSSSIDELLSINTAADIVKKPTIGVKTTFLKKLEILKSDVFSSVDNIITLNERQSDVLIDELNSQIPNDLSFVNDLNGDVNRDDTDNQNHSLEFLSDSYVSNPPNVRSTKASARLSTKASTSLSTSPSHTSTTTTVLDEISDNSSCTSRNQPTKKFPLNYSLPYFDTAFEKAANNPSIEEFGLRCRKKQQLVKTIRDDVVNTYGIDFYPTSFEFDRMVVSVKNKYPVLTKVFGEDMSLLTSALKQQFSRDRQISGCVSDLLLKKRQSHGHILSGRKLKFVKVDLVSHREYLIEEKQQSEECLMQLFQQAESLRTLVNTTNYDYSEVKAKMDITYPHRQRLVHEMKPVKHILELYPALSVSNLIIREINVHYDPFDGDIIQTLKSNFTKLFNYTDNPQKENITEDERPFFILEHLIMKRYKHSKKLLLNQEVLDAYPMIQVHKNNDSTNYSIIVEYNQLTITTSQVEAVAILIGSYEIFNIEYPKKIRATLEVLHGLSFKKRSFFLAVAAKRFLSEFKINANVK